MTAREALASLWQSTGLPQEALRFAGLAGTDPVGERPGPAVRG